jgi:hypothetical protein
VPIFLTRPQAYRLLQRELPEDTFPDGVPSGFYHTADMDSVAGTVEEAYLNLSGIYLDGFPQTCRLERIGDHEIKVFGYVSDASLTLQQRIDRVLAKLRTRRGITKADIAALVNETIPGLDFELWEWSHGEGVWELDVSQLDVETGLDGDGQALAVYGPFLCDQTPADWGMTPEEWASIKETAYTLEVRIYNYTLTADQRSALQTALDTFGRETVNHIITDGLTDADKKDGDT